MNDTDVMPQQDSQEVALAELPTFSRDQFLDIYKSFQRDLYREDISEGVVSDIIKKVFAHSSLCKKQDLYSLFKVTTLRFRQPEDISNALKLYYQAVNRLGIPLLYVMKKEDGIVSLSLGIIKSIPQEE